MGWQQIFRRAAIWLIFFASFFLSTTVHAEFQTYEGVGEYFMTDETIDFAKNQAELAAERNILEKVSVYVQSEASMIDNALDNDEIITIAAGILRVINTKFSITAEDEFINVKSFVTAQIDIDELDKLLEQEIKNRLSSE